MLASQIKMIRKIMIIVIVALLIASCKPKTGPDYPITDKDFRKGTDGLVFDLMQNAPPEKVFENAKFEIASDVWNKGASNIDEGYVTAIVENSYMCILDGDECADTSAVDSGAKSALQDLRDQRTAKLVEKDKLKNSQKPEDAARIKEIDQELAKLETDISSAESQLQLVSSDLTRDLVNDIDPAGEFGGKSVSNPEGTFKLVKFTARAKKLDLLSVQHTSPVILTACYGYTTELVQDVCIDPDVTTTKEIDKACTIEDISLTDQGAPIAITKIQTNMLPDDDVTAPQFIISVENKGKGEVISRDKLRQACSASKLESGDWNRVTVSEFGFSNDKYYYKYGDENSNIECTPNPVRLIKGAGTVRCTLKSDKISRDTPAYTTSAHVKLDYGYTQSVTKNVVIEKINS